MSYAAEPEVQMSELLSNQPTCIHCGEKIYDNGTVYVHRRLLDANGGRPMVLETQWCDESKKQFIAEVAEPARTATVDVPLVLLSKQVYGGYRGLMGGPAWDDLPEQERVAWGMAVAFLIINGSDGNKYLLAGGDAGFLLTNPVQIPG
jgi:hypothetical protein